MQPVVKLTKGEQIQSERMNDRILDNVCTCVLGREQSQQWPEKQMSAALGVQQVWHSGVPGAKVDKTEKPPRLGDWWACGGTDIHFQGCSRGFKPRCRE